MPRSCPHAHLFPNIESSPSLCVPHRCLHLLWLPVRSVLSGEPRSQGRPSLPEPRAHRPPSVRAPARRTLGGGGGPSWAAPRLPPRRPAAGAAPRAPPCPAGPGGAAHPAPLAEARKGGPRQAERRGSRMAAGQRRDTASSPLALALGLLAVAQVFGDQNQGAVFLREFTLIRRESLHDDFLSDLLDNHKTEDPLPNLQKMSFSLCDNPGPS
ncbi:uncharacterized protein GJ701_017260 [Geothlypis trichas]